jgi:hypothetical protein
MFSSHFLFKTCRAQLMTFMLLEVAAMRLILQVRKAFS